MPTQGTIDYQPRCLTVECFLQAVSRHRLGLRVESGVPCDHFAGDARLKSGFGGVHTESNQRLIYTSAWASPQKCRAPDALADSEFQRCTVSSESPQRITNQRMGSLVTIPQTSHLNSRRVVIVYFRSSEWTPGTLRHTGGSSRIWRQYRQVANLFRFNRAVELWSVVHHPQFGNDFTNQLTMTEDAHHRTL